MPILKVRDNGVWKEIGTSDSGSSVQANWAQNNPNAIDYINNRPFYDNGIKVELPIVTDLDLPFENVMDNIWMYEWDGEGDLIAYPDLADYKVVIGDNIYQYPLKEEYIDGQKVFTLGCSYIEFMYTVETGILPSEPFFAIGDSLHFMLTILSSEAPGLCSVYKIVSVVEKTFIDDTFTLNRMGTDPLFMTFLPGIDLITESSYKVTVDDNEYIVYCFPYTEKEMFGQTVYYFGGSDIEIYLGKNVSSIGVLDLTGNSSVERHITISGYASGIKKIDAKYIGDGGSITEAQVTAMINNAIGNAIGGSY